MGLLDKRVSRRDFLLSAATVTGACCRSPSARAAEGKITKVHVVFKTHLDIGFTDLAARVVQRYLTGFIPQALKLAETMRQTSPGNRFRWTTGSWLIHEYLEEADGPGRRRMEKAIEAGGICWHALPFTMHSEALDASLFDLGIRLSQTLDRRFGKKTVGAKMTDVPGHTRSIVPRLQEAGVTFLHIGVNPASSPPSVPPVFAWQAPDGSRVIVMYQKDYGGVMRIPHSSEAVAIVLTGDNRGPRDPGAVIGTYRRLRKQFPGANIVASDLSEIADAFTRVSSQLPVVRSELGDSWIHGIGSDPKKMAQLRELSRLRRTWIRSNSLRKGGTTDLAFGIPLVMIAEHTWGLDVKSHLKSWDVYTPEALRKARTTKCFARIEASWQEKRNYVQDAVRALPGGMNRRAEAALNGLKPRPPDLGRFRKTGNAGSTIESAHFSIALDPTTGALRQLRNRKTGRQWASADHPLALFAYQTFSKADYDRFRNQYLTRRPGWAIADFGKPGLGRLQTVSQTYSPRLRSEWIREDEKSHCVLAELEVLDKTGKAIPGCPRRLTAEYSLSKSETVIEITLQWFGKQANRLPEAMWLSFVPATAREGTWVMDKMGQDVDPRDVVEDGGHRLHAVAEGVRYSDPRGTMDIVSLDAPLVAPGERTLLDFDNARPAPAEGMHFCLCNNVWGTNFVMWFDDDMRFRFELRC